MAGLVPPARPKPLPLAYARPSTSSLKNDAKDVDARHKAGHDECKK
jgi:hypothetical protein